MDVKPGKRNQQTISIYPWSTGIRIQRWIWVFLYIVNTIMYFKKKKKKSFKHTYVEIRSQCNHGSLRIMPFSGVSAQVKWYVAVQKCTIFRNITDINSWCVLLHTMPTLEGELTSIYSMLRLSRVLFVVFFCCFFWDNKLRPKKLAQTTRCLL